MKILKLLNSKNLSIFILIFLLFSFNLKAEDEPEDIWDLEKKLEKDSSSKILDDDSSKIDIELENNNLNSISSIIDSNILEDNKINIVGLYDPEENGLNMDLWINSDGQEIKLILDNINKMSLSKKY